jgi:hypothetical protein
MSTVSLQLGTAQIKLDQMKNRVFAGRDPSASTLAHLDPTLSRRHAEIWLENGRTFIRDLGSVNGTWLDGQMVGAHPAELKPGMKVYLGTVPLTVEWEAAMGGGATMAAAMPAELLQKVEVRRRQTSTGMAVPVMSEAPADLGLGGKAAPIPSSLAYRRQAANGNGVILVALSGDTFSNSATIDGFVEFTAGDNETVASIVVELIEFHRKGPPEGHVWDRVLVRQGPWTAKKNDVLPLPFQLRVPPGTSMSGRGVYWEIHGNVDINWAVDVECKVPIHMKNLDIERIRDALGALDYRIADLDPAPLGQRFEGTFQPPANLRSQWGINDIALTVEYLGTNLAVNMHIDKKGLFKRDRDVKQVYDLAKLRSVPMAELSAHFKKQIDDVMTL